VPLRRTAADARAAHDPRAAIDERYKSYAEYRARFESALDQLVAERYLLAEDKKGLMERSQEEWDWITEFWKR
jgi:hypothetical protein